MTALKNGLAGVAVLLSILAPAGSQAKQQPKPAPKSQSMLVVVVRSSDKGCEARCAEWISAQGEIDSSTPAKFADVFKQLGNRTLAVFIDSPGGTVDESFEIGRVIRAKGLDVVVTKTEFKVCDKKDARCTTLTREGVRLGQPNSNLSKCASACAFVLAAGKRRFVGPGTFVGVHQVVSFRTTWKVLQRYRVETKRVMGVPVETKKTLISEERIGKRTVKTKTTDGAYERMRKYFVEMGVRESIMPLMKSASHTSIHFLTPAELKSTNMATDFANGEMLLGLSQIDTPRPVELQNVFDNMLPIRSSPNCKPQAGYTISCN